MSVTRIKGMRDLETQQVRRIPERIAAAQQNSGLDDEPLCKLMGWRLTDLVAIKAGERIPTPAEMRALYGVFGKSRQGTLQTQWLDGDTPPLRPADWVILGEKIEVTETDRLAVENRRLRERIRELEAQLEAETERGQDLQAAVEAVVRRLARRQDAGPARDPVDS